MNSGRMIWGLILVVVGMLLLLDRLYVLDFGEILRTYWPLLLVVWGVKILLRTRGRSDVSSAGLPPSTDGQREPSGTASPHQLYSSSVFGDARLRVTSREFRGGTVSTVFGDTEIDLRDAALGEGEHALKISGVFGDLTILLPKDMAFAASSHTVFGDVQVNEQKREGISATLAYESPNFAGASSRLRLQASQVFGDVCVRN